MVQRPSPRVGENQFAMMRRPCRRQNDIPPRSDVLLASGRADAHCLTCQRPPPHPEGPPMNTRRNRRPALFVSLVAIVSAGAMYDVAGAAVGDLDGGGITNGVDRDVDADGILNSDDRNIDGGVAKTGRHRGRYIGDTLFNDATTETDMDGDGLADDASTELDIDGDGRPDDAVVAAVAEVVQQLHDDGSDLVRPRYQ